MRLRPAAGALALAGILLATGMPVHAAWPDQFADVNTWPTWAAQRDVTPNGISVYTGGELEEAVWWELMIGDPPASGNPADRRLFRPGDTITRAEFATILSRALGTGASDGAGGDWYKPHVAARAADAILSDSGDWSAPISRQEMGQWMGKALAWYGVPDTGSAPAFPDIASLAEREDIQRAARASVIKGYEDGTYRPERTATRTEAAVMIVRFAKLLRKHPPSPDELLDVIKASDQLISQLHHDLATRGAADFSVLEPYATPMGLYGTGGLAGAMQELHNARPEFGWPVVSDYQMTPILMRDTIALIHVTSVSQPYRSNGEPYSGTVKYDDYVYLSRKDGRWRQTNAKKPQEYPPGQEPQPES